MSRTANPMDAKISIRSMRRADVTFGMALTSETRWNQTVTDWEYFLTIRPDGCFVAEFGGAPAGTVVTLVYPPSVGWIGMLIVHPDFRRRGVGAALLNRAVAALSGCDSIVLDATPAGALVYGPEGFRVDATLERRVAPAARHPALRLGTDSAIRPMATRDIPHLDALDAPAFGASRRTLLEEWFKRAPRLAFVCESSHRIEGYVLGRPGTLYTHIGPLVATTRRVACQLLVHSRKAVSEGRVVVDCLCHDPEWTAWLDTEGFAVERPFQRMSLGTAYAPEKLGEYWLAAGPEVG